MLQCGEWLCKFDRGITEFAVSQMQVTLRKATADDAAAAWEIRNAAIRHACKGFYADDLLSLWTVGEMTDEFVEFVLQQLHVATVNGVVVGTGTINLGDGRLDAIFVRPDMMGRGIGKRIIAFLVDLGRSAGLTELKLDSTLNAAPFYRRCGFVGDAIGVYRSPRGISLDCIPMSKWIAPPVHDGQPLQQTGPP
jgi:GNAT superfamily N-acetyltransferase